MRAAVVHKPGAIPVYDRFGEPTAQDGEAVVHVTASALSQLTRGRASGRHYSASQTVPFVAGVDGVGRFDDGRRVYFAMPRAPFGGMAERTVIAAGRCVPVPDDIDDVTAAALANPGMSSWAALTERARLAPGETVLINGATGISGRLAVRIARHLGAGRVIATGRNAATLASLGADATMALNDDERALDAAFEAKFADGVDVVIDYLWGPSARALLVAAAKAAPAGRPLRFVQVGSIAGGDIVLPAAVLRASTITLMGSGIGSVATDRLLASIGAVLQAAGRAGLTVACKAVPLRDVEAAWEQPEGTGRIVFTLEA